MLYLASMGLDEIAPVTNNISPPPVFFPGSRAGYFPPCSGVGGRQESNRVVASSLDIAVTLGPW